MSMDKKVAFIGAGSMAEAVISGIVHAEILQKEKIVVTNRNNKERIDRLERRYQIQSIQDKEKVAVDADIVVLATKPYDLEPAVQSIKEYLNPTQLVISVIAGISTDDITALIGNHSPVIRAMPNTSASIGYSATALSAGKYAREEHMAEAQALFDTIGTTVIVEENDMHTVTGISGSGPAYMYYFVEAMEKAAVEAGLDKRTAIELIAQTVVGAGEMLKQSGETAASLRKKVTSPGGTTQAGLEALSAGGFQEAVQECVRNARKRSIQLGEKK
nr:pyrroline-5-carboxylate reductase [Virgibacillus ihumii]